MGGNSGEDIFGGKVRNIELLGDALNDGSDSAVVAVMDAGKQMVLDLGIETAGEFEGEAIVGSKSVRLEHLVFAPVDRVVRRGGGREDVLAERMGIADGGADDTVDFVIDNKLEGKDKTGDDSGKSNQEDGLDGGKEENRQNKVCGHADNSQDTFKSSIGCVVFDRPGHLVSLDDFPNGVEHDEGDH